MATPIIQTSFLAGEFSPELQARVDIEAYQRGAAELYNIFVDYSGGALNRAGTQWCINFWGPTGNWDAGITKLAPKLFPFVFEDDQAQVLVMHNTGVSFISDGAPVLESAKNIAAISRANPCVIRTSASHSYSDTDIVYVAGVGGMTILNGRYFIVNVIDADEFSLIDLFSGVAINSSAFAAYTSGGTVRKIYVAGQLFFTMFIDPAYIWSVKMVQSRDVLFFTSPYYPPVTLTRVSNTNWVVAVLDFTPPSNPPTGLTLDPSFTGSGTTYAYQVTVTLESNGLESQASTRVTINKDYWPNNNDSVKIDWDAVTDAAYYSVYRAPVTPDRSVADGTLFGLIGQSRGTQFMDFQIASDFATTPPKTRNPFNNGNKFPICATFFQQRLVFASTFDQPYRVWTTPVGDFYTMNRRLPPKDADALTFELASTRADPIDNVLSMPGGMLGFTAEAVYHVYGGADGAPLTPGNINADPVSRIGATALTPIGIGFHVLYMQTEANVVRDLQYNFFAASYDSTDLTVLCGHLFKGHTIVDWAFAQSPWKVVWMVRDDGRLLSMTYLPEQQVFAFALHETQGFVKQVTVIPENGEDVLYLAISRSIGTSVNPPYSSFMSGYSLSIERMCSRVIKQIEDCWFLDQAYTTRLDAVNAVIQIYDVEGESVLAFSPSGTPFSSGDIGKIIRAGGGMFEVVGYTNSSIVVVDVLRSPTQVLPNGRPLAIGPLQWTMDSNFTVLSGLWALEGKEVYALVDGMVQGPFTVASGSITLTDPGSYAVVGIPYESRLKTLKIEVQSRTSPTVQAQRKNIPAVTVRLSQSRGVELGQNYDVMESWNPRWLEPLGQPATLITGNERIIIDGDWNEGGQVCVRQAQPLPMQLLGIIPEVELGDN